MAPTVQQRSKAGKEVMSQAKIPLGDGGVLNLPVDLNDSHVMEDYEFADEQRSMLELLHKNLGNMLKIKAQTAELDESE